MGAYALAARLSDDPLFWEMARSIGVGLGLGELGASPGAEPKLNRETSATAPEILVGLLDLSRKTHHAEYLLSLLIISYSLLSKDLRPLLS